MVDFFGTQCIWIWKSQKLIQNDKSCFLFLQQCLKLYLNQCLQHVYGYSILRCCRMKTADFALELQFVGIVQGAPKKPSLFLSVDNCNNQQ